MSIRLLLKNVMVRISIRSQKFCSESFANNMVYLESLPNPKAHDTRSYLQYKCQNRLLSRNIVFAQNLAAVILFPILFVSIVIKSLFVATNKTGKGGKNSVFITSGISFQTLPNELVSEYDKIFTASFGERMYLKGTDVTFVLLLFLKYWYAPYFVFKSMLKIGLYSNLINQYKPQSIISYSEYSFTSSLLTSYCNRKHIEHINIMHGEKLLNIRDSFVSYDRFYVWDQFYIDLLLKLRAEPNQFVIALPSSLIMELPQSDIKYELTYYLTAESKSVLQEVKKNLLNTGISVEKICLRFHPRYSDVPYIKELFSGFQFENPHEVSLEQSVSHTRNIVSLYSTVLYQAYRSGLSIVIDNISNPEFFKYLAISKYIMLNKPHKLLSDSIQS